MSGDVQPRKRKDKKKAKRDSLDRRSEGDIFTRKLSAKDDEEVKESHHGVHAEKLGKDDVLLHVQNDHGTGGHWCAKLLFFSLMAILFGIVGLIILENRGSSDIDTPLSESRFSEYFEGWVDEHRQAHDDHHGAKTGLEDHDSGPFEEEEDHSEQDEDDGHDIDHGDDHDEEGDEDEAHDEDHEDEKNEEDDEGDDVIESEYTKTEANPTEYARSKRNVADEADDEDEGFEEGANEDEENVDDNNEDDGGANNDEENDEENPEDEDDAPFEESITNKPKSAMELELLKDELKKSVRNSEDKKLIEVGNEEKQTLPNIKDTLAVDVPLKTSKDDEDFDDADESLEQVIDNDAGEELHLRQRAEQEELAAKAAVQEDEETESAPLAVKVAVGLALAFVARLVLVKKTKPPKPDEPVEGSPLARRRFTMISAEDDIPVENVDIADEEMVEDDYLDEGDDEDPELQYSDEYDEEEDDVEELEEDEEVVLGDEDEQEKNVHIEKYIPETFEQLNAMYRPKPPEAHIQPRPVEKPFEAPINVSHRPQIPPKVAPQQPMIDNLPKVVPSRAEVITKISQSDQIPKKYVEQPSNVADDDLEADEELVDDEELYDEEVYSGSEEEIEDDVSDVDDDDLMQRLEAKYGKLPERQYESDEDDPDEQSWTKVRGPQSYLDDDSFIDEEIRRANEELFNDNLKSSLQIFETLTLKFPEHPGALYGKANVLDRLATKYRSNEMLGDTIDAYRAVINLGDKISDEMFREATERCLERMRFRGMLTQAVPIHRMLIRRFSNEPEVRNQLAVTYLMLNRYTEAKYILHNTLIRWRDNGFAQVHYGFILKVHDNDLKGSVALLREGIASGENGTQDGRFYFTLGDALQRLGETKEALEVYQKGAELKLFPSVYQRSLYNVDGLKAQPFWTPQETTYEKELYLLQRNWELIQREGLSALKNQGLYIDEAESLRETGDWKQLELFARGSRIEKNCIKTPFTCNMIETFPAARTCKRGQVKFSIMQPGTHVWPHCGPTNCRLRGHLGLVVPSGTKLRVATEERTWSAGQWLIFDDSFEHEVWHNGTSPRLVLIVDMWHPEVTEAQRDSLSRI